MNSTTYTVSVAPTSVFLRWRCSVCGGQTEKDGVDATFTDEEGHSHDVCWLCLDSGSEQVPTRLLAQAEQAEVWARVLRRWAEASWELPAVDEYWRLAREASEQLEAMVAAWERGPGEER